MGFPTNVTTVKITGRLLVSTVDGHRPTTERVAVPAKLQVEFTPEVIKVPAPGAQAGPTTFYRPDGDLPDMVRGVIDAEGYLCTPDPNNPAYPMFRSVRLMATDDDAISVKDWTWRVTVKTTAGKLVESYSIAVPKAAALNGLDLTNLAPVPSTPGYGLPQAEAAAAAAAQDAQAAADAASRAESQVGATVTEGEVVGDDLILRRSNGETINAGDVRGPRGLPGPNSIPTDEAVAEYIGTDATNTQTAGDARWVTNEGADATVRALIDTDGSATQASTDARITAQVQPVREFAGEAPSILGQRFDRMSFFCFWEARPAGSLAWCQGFSINEDTQEIYVSAYDYSITVPAQWIECRNYDGTLKWRTPDIPVNSTSAYSEGLPWYYNGTGELCFILRLDVPSEGGMVRTYNSVTGALSAAIPVAGNSKLFADENYFYCATSVPSLAQLNTAFIYDLASVIAGTPTLIQTVELERFGAPRQDEKPQGFAAANGVFLASTGKRNGEEEGNGKPGIRLYSSTGSLISATSYDRLDFRAVLSDLWDPGPVHPNGVNYENEGVYPLRDGSIAVMHMLYENACITIHGSAAERKVKTVAPAIQRETPWMPIAINTAGGISEFDSASVPQFKRKGNEVFLRGAFKGVTTIGSSFVLGTLPVGCRPELPNREFNLVSNGSAYWRCRVTNGGNIQIIAYSGTITSSSWLPINCNFIADGS